jgi:hypothetical protein
MLRVAVQFKGREAGQLAVKFALPVVTDQTIIQGGFTVEGPGPELVRQTQPDTGSADDSGK